MYQGVIYRHYRITENGFEKSYIGKHEGLNPEKNRWHKDGSGYKPRNNKGTVYFWNAIQKYGWDNFIHEIVEIVQHEDEIEFKKLILQREAYWIEQFDSYYNGYNLTLGGQGVLGLVHSDVTRKRIGETLTEKWKNDEFRNFMNERCFKNEEWRETQRQSTKNEWKKENTKHKSKEKKEKYAKTLHEKHSNPDGPYGDEWLQKQYDTHRNEEYRKMQKERMLGDKNPRARSIICLETGEIFTTLKEADKTYKCNTDGYLRGKTKYAGKHPVTGEKLHWMYYDEWLETNKDLENKVENNK